MHILRTRCAYVGVGEGEDHRHDVERGQEALLYCNAGCETQKLARAKKKTRGSLQ